MKLHSLIQLIKRSALLMPLLGNKKFCSLAFSSSREKRCPLCGKGQGSRGDQGAITGAGRGQAPAALGWIRLVLCLTATKQINR